MVVYSILACGVVFYGNSLAWLMAGTYIHYETSSCKINKSKEQDRITVTKKGKQILKDKREL